MLFDIQKKLNIIMENKPKQWNKALHCRQNMHSPIPQQCADMPTSTHFFPNEKKWNDLKDNLLYWLECLIELHHVLDSADIGDNTIKEKYPALQKSTD